MMLTERQRELKEAIFEIAERMIACGNGNPTDTLAACALVGAAFAEHLKDGRKVFEAFVKATFDRFEQLATPTICPSCKRDFPPGGTCKMGGCPMGGDF